MAAPKKEGIKFGAKGGISIPIHSPANDFATLALIEMHDDNFLQDSQEITPILFLIAHYYRSSILRLLPAENARKNNLLTKQEMSCLSFTAQHFSVDEIAKKLNITPRTVHFHLQNVNKKLGVANKFDAVNKAIEMNLLIT